MSGRGTHDRQKYYKKGIDTDAARRNREETTVQIRSLRRQNSLKKMRKADGKAAGPMSMKEKKEGMTEDEDPMMDGWATEDAGQAEGQGTDDSPPDNNNAKYVTNPYGSLRIYSSTVAPPDGPTITMSAENNHIITTVDVDKHRITYEKYMHMSDLHTMNELDCIKDLLAGGDIIITPGVKKLITAAIRGPKMKSAADQLVSRTKSVSWKKGLHDIFNEIERNAGGDFFTNITLKDKDDDTAEPSIHHEYGVSEAGRTFNSVSNSESNSLQLAAAVVDAGPGNGEYIWTKEGSTIKCDPTFMQAIGLGNQDWDWKAETTGEGEPPSSVSNFNIEAEYQDIPDKSITCSKPPIEFDSAEDPFKVLRDSPCKLLITNSRKNALVSKYYLNDPEMRAKIDKILEIYLDPSGKWYLKQEKKDDKDAMDEDAMDEDAMDEDAMEKFELILIALRGKESGDTMQNVGFFVFCMFLLLCEEVQNHANEDMLTKLMSNFLPEDFVTKLKEKKKDSKIPFKDTANTSSIIVSNDHTVYARGIMLGFCALLTGADKSSGKKVNIGRVFQPEELDDEQLLEFRKSVVLNQVKKSYEDYKEKLDKPSSLWVWSIKRGGARLTTPSDKDNAAFKTVISNCDNILYILNNPTTAPSEEDPSEQNNDILSVLRNRLIGLTNLNFLDTFKKDFLLPNPIIVTDSTNPKRYVFLEEALALIPEDLKQDLNPFLQSAQPHGGGGIRPRQGRNQGNLTARVNPWTARYNLTRRRDQQRPVQQKYPYPNLNVGELLPYNPKVNYRVNEEPEVEGPQVVPEVEGPQVKVPDKHVVNLNPNKPSCLDIGDNNYLDYIATDVISDIADDILFKLFGPVPLPVEADTDPLPVAGVTDPLPPGVERDTEPWEVKKYSKYLLNNIYNYNAMLLTNPKPKLKPNPEPPPSLDELNINILSSCIDDVSKLIAADPEGDVDMKQDGDGADGQVEELEMKPSETTFDKLYTYLQDKTLLNKFSLLSDISKQDTNFQCALYDIYQEYLKNTVELDCKKNNTKNKNDYLTQIEILIGFFIEQQLQQIKQLPQPQQELQKKQLYSSLLESPNSKTWAWKIFNKNTGFIEFIDLIEKKFSTNKKKISADSVNLFAYNVNQNEDPYKDIYEMAYTHLNPPPEPEGELVGGTSKIKKNNALKKPKKSKKRRKIKKIKKTKGKYYKNSRKNLSVNKKKTIKKVSKRKLKNKSRKTRSNKKK